MNSYTWPDGSPKSQQNSFTAHLTEPRSSIQFKAKTGPKPTTDFKQFAVYSKAGQKEGV